MAFNPKNISQQDPQWKSEQLGFDNTITIGTDGCALTSLTMLVNGFGFNETPSTLNKKLKDMGPGTGFLGGLIVWGALTQAFPKIVYQRIIVCQDQPAPLGDIDASLNAGQPVVVQLDCSPSPGVQSHWVILYAKQGNDYLMLDPYPYPPDQAPVTLSSRFCFNRSPQEFITAAVWYLAQTPPAPPAPSTPPSGPGFFVQVPLDTTPGLNLRSAPSTGAGIVAMEGAGTWLQSLEPAEAAQAKIGVNGQWLNVQDPQGKTGYVAAWFVQGPGGPAPTPAPGPVPAPAPQPAPAPGSQLVVIVSQSASPTGLRLRDQPSLTGNLIVMESVGAQLTVVEPAEVAKAKIGVQDQWLNVKDNTGNTGYVAAWYVQLPGEPAPAPAPAPVPPGGTPTPAPGGTSPAGALTVSVSYLATPGLRLRSQPNLNADTLTVLSPGTRLTVTEPAGTAQAKVGVQDQWLNVKEPGGMTGYVAAWYVLPVK